MEILLTRPALTDLYRFISKIDNYPVSVDELLEKARRLKAPRPVVDFYKSFGRHQVFDDQDDLLNRSEQVGIMRRDERDMPKDYLFVPEED